MNEPRAQSAVDKQLPTKNSGLELLHSALSISLSKAVKVVAETSLALDSDTGGLKYIPNILRLLSEISVSLSIS